MAKRNDRWSQLSMKQRADLIKLYVSNGITSLNDIKKDYNSFAPGGPIEVDEYGYPADITPSIIEADYPREAEVWKRADASNADIVQRLKQGPSRITIQDWEDPKKVATHKMMSAGKYAVGNVQNINGQLFDFTDPKYGFKDPDRAAIDSAIKRGDYVEFDTEGDARYFAEHYKKHYNSFGDGGDTENNENTQTQPTLEEFLQAKADSTRNAALEKSRTRTEGIEIVYPLSEENRNAKLQILQEYYFADPNFNGPLLDWQKDKYYRSQYDRIKKELDNNCEYGFNCIGTATDNYPEDSRTNVNDDFRKNSSHYGFVGVPYEEMLPGDIVQVGNHGMIFDSFSGDIPLFNYSNGDIGPDAYRKQGRYPAGSYSVFRYKGTPTLIQQWTDEYNRTYNKTNEGKSFEDGGDTINITDASTNSAENTQPFIRQDFKHEDKDNLAKLATWFAGINKRRHGDYSLYYFGFPTENGTLGVSEYEPSISTNSNVQYVKILDKETVKNIIHRYNNPIGEEIGTNSRSSFGFRNLSPLGHFKVGRGKDSKGDYLSYYDVWDVQNKDKKNPNFEEEFYGAGKPYEIYDRIYGTFDENGKFTPFESYKYGGRILDGTEEEQTLSGKKPSKIRQGIRNAKAFAMDVAQLMQHKDLMDAIRIATKNPTPRDVMNNEYYDVAQSSFLFSPKEQKDAFLSSGYIEGTPGDYGLVTKAVGDNNYPVYQAAKDDITRDKLTVIGNVDTYYPEDGYLLHANSYPTAIYTDVEGNVYQKGWDLHNYGSDNADSKGFFSEYSVPKQIAASLLDVVGNPVVRTTGFQKLSNFDLYQLMSSIKDRTVWDKLMKTQANEAGNKVILDRKRRIYNSVIGDKLLELSSTTGKEWTDEDKAKLENELTFDMFLKNMSKYIQDVKQSYIDYNIFE